MAQTLTIIRSEYTASAVRQDQYPTDGLPEIAFLGRSNVGKSSLINKLCNRRGLARVSGSPGKTQTINFYRSILQDKDDEGERRTDFFLVDLPGYGFAKTGVKNRQLWSDFIGDYVRKSPNLALLCLLVDLRHPGLPIDTKAYEWMVDNEVPIQLVGTKEDKLKANEKSQKLALLNKTFPGAFSAVPFSALKGTGVNIVLERMALAMEE